MSNSLTNQRGNSKSPKDLLMFFLYSFFYTIGFILILPLFLLKREKYAAGFKQRLGFLPDFKKSTKPVIWVHCVSVGETNAARPLVNEIFKRYPNYRLVISTTTKTGQELAKKLFADDADLVFYFPFDWKFTVRRALNIIQPNVVLIMETEIWFNFIREASKKYAQVFIVNGRLSENSLNRYMWIKKMFKQSFRSVTAALMQTSKDAKRLMKLGIKPSKIKVTGNFKFDQEKDTSEERLSAYFKERFGFSDGSPVILAASTHSPEEKWILDAFKKVYKSGISNLPRLILVPRHPERFDEVASLIEKTGFSWVRRTSHLGLEDELADIVLLDTIGELRSLYSLADIVFVGGSLIPHGGQNILEPALAKKAIVTGSYTMNFEAIAKEFSEHDAFAQIPKLSESKTPEKLAEVFQKLIVDKKLRKRLARNAHIIMKKNTGATEKTIKYLESYLQVQNHMFTFEEKVNEEKTKKEKQEASKREHIEELVARK